MNYRSQFPDYDDVLPEIDDWDDTSYRNDVCPKLQWTSSMDNRNGAPEFTVTIWCDYKDVEKREQQGHAQYVVDIDGDPVYESDDFELIRIFILGVEALWRARSR